MTTPSPEPLKLVEECLETMGYARYGIHSCPEVNITVYSWIKCGRGIGIRSCDPLSNDFAAICKRWMREQKIKARVSLPWNEEKGALVCIVLFSSESCLPKVVTGNSENETWALAVLACAKKES